MTTRFRRPADLVICFPGGGELMAVRATVGVPVKITPGSVAVLDACRDGAAASDVAAALGAVGYEITSEEAAGALETLAGAGLLRREDGDGNSPAADFASRIMASPTWGDSWGLPGWLFYLATRDQEHLDDADLAAVGATDLRVPLFKRYPQARQEPLPTPAPLPRTVFQEILIGRRTIREFSTEPVTLQQLSQLLYYTHAPHHLVEVEVFGPLPRRSYANGGARSELELYANVTGIAGLSDGLYHYQPVAHCLELLGPALGPDRLLHLSGGWQPWCAAAPVTVFVTVIFDRSSVKYRHPLALAVIHKDTGCLGQVFQQVATSLGLGAYITGFFHATGTEEALGIDGIEEATTLIVGAGVPAPDAEQEQETIVPVRPGMVLPDAMFEDAR
jgi:SagB-type dehydrogenase family enzyme